MLKASLSDVLTLDLKRITAKGITSGSSFTPAALADSPVRFSFTPPGSSSDGGAAAREQQQGALERLVEGLQAREAAEAAAEAAQQVRSTLTSCHCKCCYVNRSTALQSNDWCWRQK